MSKPRGKQVASDIRGAWIRAVRQLEDKGKPLSSIFVSMLENDPKQALDVISKFLPKEQLLGDIDGGPLFERIKLEVVRAKETE